MQMTSDRLAADQTFEAITEALATLRDGIDDIMLLISTARCDLDLGDPACALAHTKQITRWAVNAYRLDVPHVEALASAAGDACKRLMRATP